MSTRQRVAEALWTDRSNAYRGGKHQINFFLGHPSQKRSEQQEVDDRGTASGTVRGQWSLRTLHTSVHVLECVITSAVHRHNRHCTQTPTVFISPLNNGRVEEYMNPQCPCNRISLIRGHHSLSQLFYVTKQTSTFTSDF